MFALRAVRIEHSTHLDVGSREGTFDGILEGSRDGTFDGILEGSRDGLIRRVISHRILISLLAISNIVLTWMSGHGRAHLMAYSKDHGTA
jgi:hypothetical protein